MIRERYGNLFDMYEKITGENAYQMPMRIYPGGALHHGRHVGGLQPDEHAARAVRAGRSQLLRSRREPPRRQRADARTGRRLLRPALHHRQLLRHRQAAQALRQPCRSSRRPRRTSARFTKRLLSIKGKRTAHVVAPRAGQAALGEVRHGPQRSRPEGGAASASPSCARNSGRTSTSPARTAS